MRMRLLPPQALLALLLLAWAAPAPATPVPSEIFPVGTVLKSAEKYLKGHPSEASAQYLVGRVNYLAFALARDHILAYPNDDPRNIISPDGPSNYKGERHNPLTEGISPEFAMRLQKQTVRKLSDARLLSHAMAARAAIEKAMQLAPGAAVYELTYASLLEEVRAWLQRQKPGGVPPSLSGITLEEIRGHYTRVYRRSYPEDSKRTTRTGDGLETFASYEAAVGLVRLANEDAHLSDGDRATLEEAKAAIKKFEGLPVVLVTPLVFSFTPASHLNEMLAPEHHVDFDLRGYGFPEKWPWVQPHLGFLVWDPLHTGHITSARQLFGGYTFQIFRKTGYDALAALDDDGDGALTGPELTGLAVWFDENSDGHSTPNEVTPVETLGIVRLSVRAEAFDGPHPMSPCGVTLRDGRTLPTWDWMVEPCH